MALLTVALLVLTILSLVYIFFQRKFTYWKNRGIKFIEPTVPFGNISFTKGSATFKELLHDLYALKDSLPFVGVYFFFKPGVVATDLDFIKDVLIKDFSCFHGRGIHTNEKDDPLSAHMFSLDGARWRPLRMKLSPTFTSGKMKYMFPTIVKVAERLDSTMSEILCEEDAFDVKEILARFTTDVIGECAFGLECNSLKDPNAEFRKYGRMIFERPKIGKFVRLISQIPHMAERLHIRFTRKEVSDFFMKAVRDTVEHRESNNVKRNDFMDLLIDLKNNETYDKERNVKLDKLTMDQISAQAFVFFLAGFETSSTTMMFALYELAKNPELQETLRREVNDILSKHDGKLTYEAIMDMSYLDHVIYETLRKFPPVVFLQRQAQSDYKLSNSNLVIEKGTNVMVPVYEIHHDPSYYPEPEIFNPDRFSPTNVQARHPMTFLGFGDGPRNCVGLRFGLLQSRVGLATLMKSYRFTVCDKTPIPMVFSQKNPVLSPASGMHLRVEKL